MNLGLTVSKAVKIPSPKGQRVTDRSKEPTDERWTSDCLLDERSTEINSKLLQILITN